MINTSDQFEDYWCKQRVQQQQKNGQINKNIVPSSQPLENISKEELYQLLVKERARYHLVNLENMLLRRQLKEFHHESKKNQHVRHSNG